MLIFIIYLQQLLGMRQVALEHREMNSRRVGKEMMIGHAVLTGEGRVEEIEYTCSISIVGDMDHCDVLWNIQLTLSKGKIKEGSEEDSKKERKQGSKQDGRKEASKEASR